MDIAINTEKFFQDLDYLKDKFSATMRFSIDRAGYRKSGPLHYSICMLANTAQSNHTRTDKVIIYIKKKAKDEVSFFKELAETKPVVLIKVYLTLVYLCEGRKLAKALFYKEDKIDFMVSEAHRYGLIK